MGGNREAPTTPGVVAEMLRASPGAPAELHPELTHGFWKDVPALSWLMNLADGQLQVSGMQVAVDLTEARIAVLGKLLRTMVPEKTSGPMQFLGVLPTDDGTLHHFLIIGFPIGAINGGQHPHLAGVAIDIERQKMRVDELAQQALVDELTRLYNLRGFMLFAEHELKAARRRRTLSAIIYLDLDGLKGVNDARGHSEGDALLVATATLLRHVFRECDVIARLGGDEFAIFASDVRGDPEKLERRLRSEIPVAGIIPGSPTGLSVSIGVAWCKPESRMSLEELIAAADGAMFRNKARRSDLANRDAPSTAA